MLDSIGIEPVTLRRQGTKSTTIEEFSRVYELVQNFFTTQFLRSCYLSSAVVTVSTTQLMCPHLKTHNLMIVS